MDRAAERLCGECRVPLPLSNRNLVAERAIRGLSQPPEQPSTPVRVSNRGAPLTPFLQSLLAVSTDDDDDFDVDDDDELAAFIAAVAAAAPPSFTERLGQVEDRVLRQDVRNEEMRRLLAEALQESAKANRLTDKVVDQNERALEMLKETIEKQQTTIENLREALTNQNQAIVAQKEAIVSQNETIVAQNEEITNQRKMRIPLLRQQLAMHRQVRERRRSMRLDDDAQYAEVDVALSPLRTLRPRRHAWNDRLLWELRDQARAAAAAPSTPPSAGRKSFSAHAALRWAQVLFRPPPAEETAAQRRANAWRAEAVPEEDEDAPGASRRH